MFSGGGVFGRSTFKLKCRKKWKKVVAGTSQGKGGKGAFKP